MKTRTNKTNLNLPAVLGLSLGSWLWWNRLEFGSILCLEGVKKCFTLSFSGVLEFIGVIPMSISSSVNLHRKNIEKLQTNITNIIY